MSIKRYKGQPKPVSVKYASNPLTGYNKDYADIIEVTMNLKKDLANDADDLYMERKLTVSGVTVDEPNHTFIVDLDYTNLVIGEKYKLVLAVNVGLAEYVELPLDADSRLIEITQDENRA